MLTGVLYYSNLVERVTPDTMQSPVWALLVLTVYFAVQRQSLFFWLLSGILSGIAFITKYQVIVLWIPMSLSLLLSYNGRSQLKTAGPWLAVIAALIVTIPHLLWLHQNDYPGFKYFSETYVINKTTTSTYWTDHFKYPFEFAVSNLGNIILLCFVGWPLFRMLKAGQNPLILIPRQPSDFKTLYLYCVALGPIIVTLIVGLISGKPMIPRWGTPYFAWLPLLMLVTLNRDINKKRFNTIIKISLFLGLLLWSLRTVYLYYKPYITTDYWKADEFAPAKSAMNKAEELWNNEYNYPLPFIGGDHYHVISMLANGTQAAIPFSNLNPSSSQWMSELEFRKKGGIIVYETNQPNKYLTEIVSKRYPTANYLGTFKFRPFVPEDIKDPTLSVVEFYLLPPEGAPEKTL